jgi:hypothetical protein
LSAPPAADFAVPGNATESAALGYLHANCGNCHHPRSFVSNTVDMQLWLSTESLSSVAETPSVLTTVDRPSIKSLAEVGVGGEGGASGLNDFRIVPGSPEESVLFVRMSSRLTGAQMPPIGTEMVDTAGAGLIEEWIKAL